MKLNHPDGGEIEAKAEHAPAYLSQGWQEVVEEAAPDKPKGDPKK